MVLWKSDLPSDDKWGWNPWWSCDESESRAHSITWEWTEKHGLRPHPKPLEPGLEFKEIPRRPVRREHPRIPSGTPAFSLCSIRVRKGLFFPNYVEKYLVLCRVVFKVVPLDRQYREFLKMCKKCKSSVILRAHCIGNAGDQAAVERSLTVMLWIRVWESLPPC